MLNVVWNEYIFTELLVFEVTYLFYVIVCSCFFFWFVFLKFVILFVAFSIGSEFFSMDIELKYISKKLKIVVGGDRKFLKWLGIKYGV